MQRCTERSTLRRQVEVLAARPCPRCGATLDAELLRARLDEIIEQANEEIAALLQNLKQCCRACCREEEARGVLRAPPLQRLAQRRRAEVREYFATAPARVLDNTRLREPQIESYRAVAEYFKGNRHLQRATMRVSLPAIVEIPTGCGKTGIICAAPYGVATGRVLIVTPNLTIKRNLVNSLAPLDESGEANADNFFLKTGIFDDLRHLPRFVVLESGQTNDEDCLRADCVVTNIQQMPAWVSRFEPDFFDMIIVDEAHHEPADSWQRVNEAFPLAKKILLTATPFRCDGKPIIGQTVYQYRLANAIANGYVKNVMKVEAVASRLTFTLDGETRDFSYDEITAMREELWFSRGVALSPVCNATIVERSIALWRQKRGSGIGHQIIGAACSIRHAQQIVELYRARGIKSTHVASEGMSFDERARRIRDYEAGIYDCMVHVGILGEGYDNPNISVAAIFRPYRSLSPYVQFVGRTLRWIRNAHTDADNLAHVVSHSGLNLNYLWEYFKHETREAAILSYIDNLFFADENSGGELPGEALPECEVEDEETLSEVTGEELEGWDVDTFLPVERLDLSAVGPLVSRFEAFKATLQGRGFRQFGREQERTRRARTLRERTGSAPSTPRRRLLPKTAGESTLPLPFNRPDVERRQWRQRLVKDVQRAAGALMNALHLPNDDSLLEYIAERDERSNYEALVRHLNRRLNAALGKDESHGGRHDWTLDELREAHSQIPLARKDVVAHLRRKLLEREQAKLPF
jgi:superfamily II DNA or RNA helicase